MRLASIKLDNIKHELDANGQVQYGPERRGTINLIHGRLICDGNDITPMSGKYPRGEAGRNRACADIEAMYGRGATWDLRWLKARE